MNWKPGQQGERHRLIPLQTITESVAFGNTFCERHVRKDFRISGFLIAGLSFVAHSKSRMRTFAKCHNTTKDFSR